MSLQIFDAAWRPLKDEAGRPSPGELRLPPSTACGGGKRAQRAGEGSGYLGMTD